MWKAKRKSRQRKNDKKISECEEFREKRERYLELRRQFRQEFKEYCENRDKKMRKEPDRYE